MLGLLKRKPIVRTAVFALLLTMTAWMLPTGHQEASAAVNLKNPRTSGETVTWDCVWFGSYPQSSDGSGSFKNEPIKWRVLSVDGTEALLLADKNLDAGKYHEEAGEATWETCGARTWLNGTGSDNFLGKAFSSAQQAAIYEKTVPDTGNPDWETEGGNATTDKVFFLSIDEAISEAYGFPADYEEESDTRRALNTDYAVDRGAYTDEDYEGCGFWWLRSSGRSTGYAAFVNPFGCVDCGGDLLGRVPLAIRPALRLNLSSSVWSYAGTVSSDGQVNESGGSTVNPGDPEKPQTPQTPQLRPGTVITDKNTNGTYKVTSNTGSIVTYVRPTDKNKANIIIPSTIKAGTKTCKVTAIAAGAFKKNQKLKSVAITDGIKTIGANAFYGCGGLTKATIGKNTASIGTGAFQNCKKLKTITIKTTKLTSKAIGKNAFKGISSKAVIKVPKSKVKAYKKLLQAKGLSKKAKVK